MRPSLLTSDHQAIECANEAQSHWSSFRRGFPACDRVAISDNQEQIASHVLATYFMPTTQTLLSSQVSTEAFCSERGRGAICIGSREVWQFAARCAQKLSDMSQRRHWRMQTSLHIKEHSAAESEDCAQIRGENLQRGPESIEDESKRTSSSRKFLCASQDTKRLRMKTEHRSIESSSREVCRFWVTRRETCGVVSKKKRRLLPYPSTSCSNQSATFPE